MDRTDTVYLYVYIQYFVGAWLALRMPPRPPPSVFSKPSGAESQVFKTESVSELYIMHCWQEFLRIIYILIFIYIYLSIYLTICLSIYMCLCLDAGIIHRKLAGSTKSSGQTGFRSTEICQKGSQHCGGFGWWHVMDTFFGFCSDFADTGKTENTENAGNTHYTHI